MGADADIALEHNRNSGVLQDQNITVLIKYIYSFHYFLQLFFQKDRAL